jgi:hypothetical protein
VRKARKNLSQRFSCELPRRDCHKLRKWMPQKQAHQLFADVARSADYRDVRFAAASDGGLRSFAHSAQCVFRLGLIATESL